MLNLIVVTLEQYWVIYSEASKFRKIDRKTPVTESLLNKVAG